MVMTVRCEDIMVVDRGERDRVAERHFFCGPR